MYRPLFNNVDSSRRVIYKQFRLGPYSDRAQITVPIIRASGATDIQAKQNKLLWYS